MRANHTYRQHADAEDIDFAVAPLLDMVFQPLVLNFVPLYSRSVIPEPPYARLLRRLGLFDPMELPPTQRRAPQSTFPVVVRSASGVVHDGYERYSNGHIIDSLGHLFGESARWAVGDLFGRVRDAMDYIEDQVARPVPLPSNKDQEYRDDPSLCQTLRTDFGHLFPDPTDEEKKNGYNRSYHVTTRILADGAIETRKTIRTNDGAEETIIIKRYPNSDTAEETASTSKPSSPASSAANIHETPDT
ncbi:hypothetical protein GGI12_003696 [Dipsacomyces acuminosporus]|nr:hypothetical protein GGI12_003696 [Dipsacomyces acuminosporus]